MNANETANPQVAAACEKNAADLFTAGSVAYFEEAIAQGFAWILDPTTGA